MGASGDGDAMASSCTRSPNQSEPKDTYEVREQALGTCKHVRIVGIGAGASGLNLIRTLRLSLTNYDVVVYEKNADVGGTWFENTYPGCRCDVPSHSYQFTWRPKYDWINLFAPGPEIKGYLSQVCDEEGMRDSIKMLHSVRSARWNEDETIWELVVRNEKTGEEFRDHATFLVNGTGVLNNWKWPDAPGIRDFRGTMIHTARWPKNFDHSNKVMAVIGNGATGIQVLPELQPGAKRIYHIVRTPTWVAPPRIQAWKMMGQAQDVLSAIELDAKGDISPKTIEKFKTDAAFYRKFVKGLDVVASNNFSLMIRNGPASKLAQAKVTEYMTTMLGKDEKLCETLIPKYPLGFRRLTPGHTYLQALTKANVEIITQDIRRFVSAGIELASGEILKVDAIVCASGFKTSFCPRIPIIGRNGNLQDIWKTSVPRAYMSLAVGGLPNYFTFFGPNCPIGHGSVFTLSEHIAKYIAGVIKKCQTEGIKAITPSRAAVDEYFEHISAFMPRTTWASDGRSWFKAGERHGPVVALHPGSRTHFLHMIKQFRGEDWDYMYDNAHQNRFAYLGNGFSTIELEPKGDTAWYWDSL